MAFKSTLFHASMIGNFNRLPIWFDITQCFALIKTVGKYRPPYSQLKAFRVGMKNKITRKEKEYNII